jgi:murein DD-endopeptidase MepM/ murein hydrolase activator NlpD
MKKIIFLLYVITFPVFMFSQNNVNFTAKDDSNLTVHYFDASNFEGTTWLWKFGDGATSTLRNPIHVYASPGTYTVCLTVDSEPEECKPNVFKVTSSGLQIKYDDTIWPTGSIADVFSPFGSRLLGSSQDFHRGIDIKGNQGDPIYASADGVIHQAYSFGDPNNPYGGGVVVIEHTMDTPMYFHGLFISTYYTTNLHMNSIESGIVSGVVVAPGTLIGTVGDTGAVYLNYHNHFEVRIGLQCSIEAQQTGCSSSPFSVPQDPYVNPYLFLDYDLENTNSLSYSANTNFTSTTVVVSSNRPEVDFNEINLITDNFTKTVNFNNREGNDPNDRDNLTFNDVTRIPSSYTRDGNEDYELTFVFTGVTNYNAIEVKDISGNTVDNTDYYGEFCSAIIYDDFDFSDGNWNDGGNNCFRGTSYSLGGFGKKSMRLKHGNEVANTDPDVDPQSSLFTNALDLSLYTDLRVSLSFITPNTDGYDAGDDFILEVSTDGGASYTAVKIWEFGIDFDSDRWYHESVNVSGITFTTTTVVRIRSHADNDLNRVYIDNVTVRGCDSSLLSNIDFDIEDAAKVFPNPTNGALHIYGKNMRSIEVYNFLGQKILSKKYEEITNSIDLDLNKQKSGVYFLRIETDKGVIFKKGIKENAHH